MSNKAKRESLVDTIVSFGGALLIVLVIRSSVVEAFKIPSGSMIPTLLVGDYIFVNKLAYGIKLPFSDWIGDDPIYLKKGDNPARGEIIVFKNPTDTSIYYIKRVIGTPGDRVEMRDKIVYVNGVAQEKTPVPNDVREKVLKTLEDSPQYRPDSVVLSYEKVGAVTPEPITMVDKDLGASVSFPEIKVPEGHFFVMGDNRDNSNDSRFWGFVPERHIRGRAVVIWFSLWLDFDTSFYAFRPSRIGTVLH
jgi:signal peptidase I